MGIFYTANKTNEYGNGIHQVITATKTDVGTSNYDIVVISDLSKDVRGFINSLVIDNGEVREKTTDEYEVDRQNRLLNRVRSLRNYALSETDKYKIDDYPLTSTIEQINSFRQTLRDLPESLDLSKVENLSEIDWPIDPEGHIVYNFESN